MSGDLLTIRGYGESQNITHEKLIAAITWFGA